MATAYLHCDECGKTLNTFQALLKHFAQRHAGKQLPERAVFRDGNREISQIAPQAIRLPLIKAEYKAWMVGLTERINGIHHQRHKSKFTISTRSYKLFLFLGIITLVTNPFMLPQKIDSRVNIQPGPFPRVRSGKICSVQR